MADSLWDLTLAAALAETASAQPTPGGGSIAPVSGAFGFGLVLMALEVTQAKQASESLGAAIAQGRALLSELQAHADQDVAVFQAYMHALGLPRATPEEQAVRTAARTTAATAATEAPLAAAESCLRALMFAEAAAGSVQKNVYSDLLAGADLVLGALHAVLRTLDINLPSVRDEAQRAQLQARGVSLRQEAARVHASIPGSTA